MLRLTLSSSLPLMASHCHCLHNQQQRKYKHNHSFFFTSQQHHHRCSHSSSNPCDLHPPIFFFKPSLSSLLLFFTSTSTSQTRIPFPLRPTTNPNTSINFPHSSNRRLRVLSTPSLHLSSTSTPTPKPPLTLRDLAARTIQTHFRAFLVRRSRNLRHLKHLAIIKSNLTLLKSSTHLTSQALSHKAMDLLLTLYSIQGSDLMIRNGKRSISKDLLRFLKLVDAGVSSVTLQQHHHHNKLSFFILNNNRVRRRMLDLPKTSVNPEGFSDPPDHQEEEDVIHIEDEQRVCSDHDHQQQQQLELVKNLRRRLEELEGCSRDSERKLMIENEKEEYVEPPRNGVIGMNKVGNRKLLFSAPLPVQMEPSR